jgi:hypothetical protein
MTKDEFLNLRIGDTVVITNHGKNKGKMGIVDDIIRGGVFGLGCAYLEPFECEFEFSNSLRPKNKEGLYGWNHHGINYPKSPVSKDFYIEAMYTRDGVSWAANNFTLSELIVIERFLKEFNEHATGLVVDSLAILDRG